MVEYSPKILASEDKATTTTNQKQWRRNCEARIFVSIARLSVSFKPEA